MKKIISTGIAVDILLLLTSALYIYPSAPKNQTVAPQTGKGLAVLELFTSEGCSSCPPADELLERLQKEYVQQPVYLLAYHVDYWDRQGWKDVFSDPAFSKRQRWYNTKFTSQIYTPQLIINGNKEFVGSDESQIRSGLTAELGQSMPAALRIRAQQQANKLNIQYQANGNKTGMQLVVALVQKHALRQVKAGENEGRTLSHVQIVRSLNVFQVTPQGNEDMSLPVGFDRKGWEVIGFLQDSRTGAIWSAARAYL